jgi:hypothetical protein
MNNFNWEEAILKELNEEEWCSLVPVVLCCSNEKEMEEAKKAVLDLKEQGQIELQCATSEEILEYIKKLSDKKGGSIDEEKKKQFIKVAEENSGNIWKFFFNSAKKLKK